MLGQTRRRGARRPRARLPGLRDARTPRAWAAPIRSPTPPAWRRRSSPRAPRTRARARSCSSTRTTGGPGIAAAAADGAAAAARPCCSPRAASCPRRRPTRSTSSSRPGAKAAGGAQVIRIGDVGRAGRPQGDRRHRAATRPRPRAAIDKPAGGRRGKRGAGRARRLRRPARLRDARRRAGRPSRATRCCGRAATRCRPRPRRRSRPHGKPQIYVLGPEDVISETRRRASCASSAPSSGSPGADPVTNAIAVRALHATATSAGASTDPGHGFVFASTAADARRGRRRAAVGARAPTARCCWSRRPRRCPPGAAGLPARHPARLRQGPGARRLQSRLADGRRGGHLRGRAVAHRHPPRDPARRHRRRLTPMAQAEQPERLRPQHQGHGRRRAPADGRLHAALRPAAAQPHPQADRAACRRTTRPAALGEQEIARLERLGFTGEVRGEGFQDGQRPLPVARTSTSRRAARAMTHRCATAAALQPRGRRPGQGLADERRPVRPRAPRGGARPACGGPVVARAGEHLREQDREDDLAGGLRVRPAPGLSAQGDQEQERATFATPSCQGSHDGRIAGLGSRDHARRALPRLLALVHPAGAGGARGAGRRARAGLRVGLGGVGPGRGLGARACWPARPSGSRSAPGLLQIPARPPAGDRDGRRDARRPERRALPARARRVRARRCPRAGTACRSRGRSRRTREYVEIVRAALARARPLVHEGREYRSRWADGRGKPLKLLARPVQERIPIYLGAVGPKAVEQAGEIADGWLPFMLDPRARRDAARAAATAGSRRPGRTRADIDIAACVADGRRRRPRRGARRRAPVAGLLPRRDGLAARRTSTSSCAERAGPRRRGARVPGRVPRRRPRARGRAR